ncbi:MAG: zinc-ribbon domain-containing protein [Pseudomonadota bacterium]
MSSRTITLSGPDVLCEYVPVDDVKGFFQQRIGVGPDLMAMLIRDGKVAHVSHGAHIALGGFWRGIKDSLAGTHALRLLIADLKPFSATGLVTSITRDSVPVEGEVSLELQVNPEKPEGVLGFASDHEITPKAVMWERLAPHLGDRVLQAVVRKVDALELRGDVDAQNKVQAEIMAEAERVFGDMGLLVRAVSVNWGFNEEELAEIQKRAETREQEMLDAKLANFSREIARTAEITTLQLNTELAEEQLKAANDSELRQMLLAQELEFVDAKETGARTARMKALEGEITELKLEQQAKFDLALGEAKNDLDLRKIKMEIEKLDRETDKLNRQQESALGKLEEMDKLEIASAARKEQMASLKGLQDIEIEGEAARANIADRSADAEHEREMGRIRQEDDARLAEMRLKRDMSPDQILAMQAGLSADVAAVFAERAKSDASDTAEKMALMERLIESGAKTGDQAKFFFEQFKEGVVSAVSAASDAGPSRAPEKTPVATVICPRCRSENEADAAFCRACGAPLRS